jgi:hypothetical protein
MTPERPYVKSKGDTPNLRDILKTKSNGNVPAMEKPKSPLLQNQVDSQVTELPARTIFHTFQNYFTEYRASMPNYVQHSVYNKSIIYEKSENVTFIWQKRTNNRNRLIDTRILR